MIGVVYMGGLIIELCYNVGDRTLGLVDITSGRPGGLLLPSKLDAALSDSAWTTWKGRTCYNLGLGLNVDGDQALSVFNKLNAAHEIPHFELEEGNVGRIDMIRFGGRCGAYV